MRNKSNRLCCVPQCESRCSTEISLMKFPQDESSRKKWASALNIDQEITPNMQVCSLHFLPNDFDTSGYSRRIQLKKEVIPSQNLPQVFNKSERKARCRSLENRSSRINRIQDDSTKLSDQRPRRRKTGVSRIKVFESCPSPQNSLNLSLKGRTNPTSRSVGVQTDAPYDLDVKNNRDNVDQTSLSKSIDYLRKNLVGHVVKIKENTFTINECSISFKNEKIDEINMLVIQPDKLISSGTLLLEAMLGGCEIGRLQDRDKTNGQMINISSDTNYSNQSQEFEKSNEAMQYCVVEMKDDTTVAEEKFSSIPVNCHSTPCIKKNAENPISNICDTNKKNSKTENITTEDRSIVPVFDKTVKVLINKLPESLVKAIQDGNRVRVSPNEITKKVDPNPQQNLVPDNIEVTPKVKPIKLESVKCGICKEIFPNLANFYEHKKIHQNAAKMGTIPEEDHNLIKYSIEDVKPYGVQKHPPTQEKLFSCDICDRTFQCYHSFKFHKETIHNCENGTEKPRIESGHCKDLLEVENEKETCPECLGVYQNKKQLDLHLLDCHKVVLKKSIYACDNCPKSFITYRSLVYHKTKTHDIPMSEDVVLKLKCSNCKKLIESNEYRIVHLKNCLKNFEQEKEKVMDEIGKEIRKEPTVAQEVSKEVNEMQEVEKRNLSNYEEPLESDNDLQITEHGIIIKKRKRSSTSSCVSQNDDPKEKRLKLDEEPENSPADGSSSKILDRLKALLGSNDGPNDITIELDE